MAGGSSTARSTAPTKPTSPTKSTSPKSTSPTRTTPRTPRNHAKATSNPNPPATSPVVQIPAVTLPACVPGSWPSLKTPEQYTPVGEYSFVDDLPVYVVGKLTGTGSPADQPVRALIVWPEATGWSGRVRHICDQMASEGFYVVMPDHMRGQSLNDYETEEGKNEFLSSWSSFEGVVHNDIKNLLLPYMEKRNVKAIGALGFGWGGWLAWRASAKGFPIKAVACCHPTVNVEGLHGRSELKLVKQLRCPLLCLAGEDDVETVKEEGDCAIIFQEKFPCSVFKDFPEMKSGWVSSGDVKVPEIRNSVKCSLQLCLDFVKHHVHTGNAIQPPELKVIAMDLRRAATFAPKSAKTSPTAIKIG